MVGRATHVNDDAHSADTHSADTSKADTRSADTSSADTSKADTRSADTSSADAGRSAPATGPGLATVLRTATAAEHRDTETRSFISQLMGGELCRDDYARYLAQYAHVYRALESRTPGADEPAFLSDPALLRTAAIEADLESLAGPGWETEHPPLAATAVYVSELEAVRDDVPRYTAHHYTRYLGDLSGGQAIAALVARHYDVGEEQLNFYRFDAIESAVRYKRWYREQLDALDFTPAQADASVAEAKRAFVLNADVFDALDQSSSATDAE